MATPAQWVAGARPRTLPAAVSPVLAGTGAAAFEHQLVWWKAALALVVSLALQVAVNYANDYSDGIKGTDDDRVGPLRLVGSRTAAPGQVMAAALVSFSIAGVAGLLLAATSSWWLLLVGAVAVAAAWYYTGGSRPYGYRALGELSVFVFFGLVAVIGTAFVQTDHIGGGVVVLAGGIGALACAILVANNMRDVATDRLAGKQTLAVLIGDRGSRGLFAALHAVAAAVVGVLAGTQTWWVLLAFAAAPFGLRAQTAVWRRATGPQLVPVLRDAGLTELVYAAGLFVGYVLASR